MNPYNARVIFDQASREAYARNGHRCVCEHVVTVIIKTKGRGMKRIVLGAHGCVHFSTCSHSEMERTTRPGTAPPRRRKALNVETLEDRMARESQRQIDEGEK